MEVDNGVIGKIIRKLRDADNYNKKFSSQWRDTISEWCRDLPFSTLRRAFLDRYGAINQGGKSLNTSTHNNNNENNRHLEWETMEDNNNNNPNLDFDAMEEILRRVPVPSLMRAKSVCKSWNTAISATTFNVKETHHFVTQQIYNGTIAFFCAALNQWFPIRLPWNKCLTFLNLCTAAEGLFLFLHLHDSPVIYNLLTKQHRFLPRLDCPWPFAAAELIVEADHFEIIIIDLEHRVQLYDSSTDEWKFIFARADFFGGPKHRHYWKSTLHNGMAYFTNDYGRNLGCYDFARREFQYKEIEGGLPPQIDYRDLDNNSHSSLPSFVASNGKVLFVARLEKEAGEGGSIWGGFPFIEHSLVGIWELDSRAENSKSWSLVSVTPQHLLEDTVKSSHGTDFMVAASTDKIWLTIKGSMNVLTLDLRSTEWSVLPGYTAEELVDSIPRRAFFVPFRICPSLGLSANPREPID